MEFDLRSHLRRQIRWSRETFGPGNRQAGIIDHIEKELREIESAEALGEPTLPEWIDVIILAFDGAWRSGAFPFEIIDALISKQEVNEGRIWPDWRELLDSRFAIEHIREDNRAQD